MCHLDRIGTPCDFLGQAITDLSDIGLETIRDDCDYVPFEEVSDIIVGNSNFKALQLNIHGLLSKQTELSKFINGCLKNSQIDLVILCETWLTPDVKSLVHIPGYEYYGIEQKKEGWRH